MKSVMTDTQAKAFAYARIFEEERQQVYPVVSAFEEACGHAVDRTKLESAARVLACPLKTNPPNWMHGRVLYAAARQYFDAINPPEPVSILDIGTAKGFSALCLEWARIDSRILGRVTSVDVLDPNGTQPRNTIAELAAPVTLHQILEPWPEADAIDFRQSTGVENLRQHTGRLHFAFVDGKHSGQVVSTEAELLAKRQEPGDVVIFDDAQMQDVAEAIAKTKHLYELTYLTAKPGRIYVIGRRR
jgi:predicted O-methyltransferase YrrM